MALFKHYRGDRASLDAQPLHDGYAYFCTNDGTFHIDYADKDGVLHRKQINAKEAEALIGYDITTILNSSDLEIPTSKAVLDTINITDNKVDALIGPYSEGLEYTLKDNDSYEVKSIGTCTDTTIIIPCIYNGKRVTSIGYGAFLDCSFLTNVIIPNSVIIIGDGAFAGCYSLTNIDIPYGVTGIGSNAFQACSTLTSIIIPDSVTQIGIGIFNDCSNLTSVIIGNSITGIREEMFKGCTALTSIDIPDSVTSIGEGAFSSCTSLTNIVIPNGVKSINNYAFSGCDSLTSITMPDSVTGIGDLAFFSCDNLTSATIPNSVTFIGHQAFIGCNNLAIYCEVELQPDQWDDTWNPDNRPVVWGAALDFVDVNEKLSNYTTAEYVNNTIGDAIVEAFNEPRKELFWQSSTEGSTKKFKTTVDDSGTMTTARIYDYVEIPVASSFDNTGDGIPEVYLFSKVLPEPFESTDVIQIDAVNDITDNNGVHQEAGSHYMKYDEVAAGIGTLPPHVYCYDNSTNYLRYSFNVDEDGIYELAAHLRIKDEQLRGATYTINKGTNFEHAFVTTYGWDSKEEAFAVRNSDELQGSYMHGMLVHLHAGVNTIHITTAVGVTKNQHFRNLYLVKTADLLTNEPKKLTMNEAENIGVGLAEGAILPEYSDITVTFNNGAPRETDGFCRVITSNGHKMSIQKITLTNGQRMPVANRTVTLRGKIGCVNSAVNSSIGQEARIFDATIIEGLIFRLKSDNTYEVSGIGVGTDTDIVIPSKVDGISVTSIGDYAFYYCESLTSIEIPDSVTSIGHNAFQNCTSLTSITIPDSVTSIGSTIFIDCYNLTIYCEAKSQPEDWNIDWNLDGYPVIWGVPFDIHSFYSSMVSSAPQIAIGDSLNPTLLIMYSAVNYRCCGAEIYWREEGSSSWNVAYVPISAFSHEMLYNYDLANLISDSYYPFDITKPCEIYAKKAEYGKLMSPASNIVVYKPNGGTVKISYNGIIYSGFTSKTVWNAITDLQFTTSDGSDSAMITISGNAVFFKGLPVVTSNYNNVASLDTIDFDMTYIALDD